MRSRTNLLLTALTLLAAGTIGAYAADNDEMIKNAMSAAPKVVGENANVVTFDDKMQMVVLKKGTNGFTCISAAAWCALVAVDFGGDDFASFVITASAMLFDTSFGPAWLVRFGAVLLLVLVAVSWPRPAALLALSAIVLASEAWIGHASVGGLTHCVIQSCHLLPAGAWLGGLVPLFLVLRQGARERTAADGAWSVLVRFSAIGMICVGLILVTGIINTSIMLGRLPGLATDYERILLLKIALFVVLVLVAMFNRFRLLPLLATDAGSHTAVFRLLSRTVLVEQVLGISLLLVASVLGLANPAA